MLKFSRLLVLVLGFYSVIPVIHAQDTQQTEQQVQEREARIQERAARREERRRQIDSLTDEQRQALRERQRIREARGAGQRGQRPPRAHSSRTPSQQAAEAENGNSL
jgi:chromosome segregation ATPase